MSYFELVEGFEAETERLRELGPTHYDVEGAKIMTQVRMALSGVGDDSFEKLMIWHTDKLYRVINHVDMLDRASLTFLLALGMGFDAVARERGRAMAYIVDNMVPFDRLMGLQAAFKSLQFVVASPELIAIELGKHDGIDAEAALQAFSRYSAEATAVALRLVDKVLEEQRHFIWLSGETDTSVLRIVASKIAGRPYVGVFRNDAPDDGTEVQVFQATGVQDPLGV